MNDERNAVDWIEILVTVALRTRSGRSPSRQVRDVLAANPVEQHDLEVIEGWLA